jgi:hypothetical protein
MTNHIFLILIFILIASYLKIYFRKKKDFRILQTSVNDFSPSMLCDKYPIYIDDSIVNINELLLTTFKYEYWFQKIVSYTDIGARIKTKCKFTLIHNDKESIQILYIRNEHDFVQIKLYPYNMIILPLGWEYKMDTECDVIELNDLFHKLFI